MNSVSKNAARALVSTPFQNLKMSDDRLLSRLSQIVDCIKEAPHRSFPAIFKHKSALDGFYRFVNNQRVNASEITHAVCEETANAINRRGNNQLALAIHDTSNFSFAKNSQIEGLGRITNKQKGFFGHFCIAVTLDREIIGLLGLNTWTRPEERLGYRTSKQRRADPTSETHKWSNLIREVKAKIQNSSSDGSLTNSRNVVHVADREADDYTDFCGYVDKGDRFVFRSSFDRNIQDSEYAKLRESLGAAQMVCQREVALSARRPSKNENDHRTHPVRKKRVAHLGIAAKAIEVRRGDKLSIDLPKTLKLNFVRVFEMETPLGEEPIEWILITTEPIGSPEDLLRIVDIYRARWTIEEYFKALKTGCAFEKRGLESFSALLNCLAIFAPIACSLYNLKTIGQEQPEKNPETVASPIQIKIISQSIHRDEKTLNSAQSVMLGIASMGGHLKHNGPPGWQVLARGYERLLLLEQGWILATQTKQEQNTAICEEW